VAIMNPSSSTATIAITARNAAGATIGTSSLTLQPLNHTAADLSTFPGLSGIVGQSGGTGASRPRVSVHIHPADDWSDLSSSTDVCLQNRQLFQSEHNSKRARSNRHSRPGCLRRGSHPIFPRRSARCCQPDLSEYRYVVCWANREQSVGGPA
jgi:hypothetical protein